MSRAEILTVFSCDVSDNRRRRKMAKLLEEAATRVQYWVFEVRMTRTRTEIMGQRIAALLGPGDSLRVYALGRTGEDRSRVYGDGTPFESDEGFWIV